EPLRALRALRSLLNLSVAFRKPGFGDGGTVAADAGAARRRAIERHVADGRLGVRFYLRLAVSLSAPRRDHESWPALHHFLELPVGADALRVLLAELERALVEAGP